MTAPNPTLTPNARLENLRDRTGNLRARVDSLEARAHLSDTLRRDLEQVRNVLDRVTSDTTAAISAVARLGEVIGNDLDERCKNFAHSTVLIHSPWLEYAGTRLDAAAVMFHSHKPAA